MEHIFLGESDIPEAYYTINFPSGRCVCSPKILFKQKLAEAFKVGIDFREELPSDLELLSATVDVYKIQAGQKVLANGEFTSLAATVVADPETGLNTFIRIDLDGTVVAPYELHLTVDADDTFTVLEKRFNFRVET